MIEKKIIIYNLAVNYYVSENFNNNSPLVYIHGWSSEARHFGRVLEKCDNFIAIDLPGFGKSEMLKTIWTTGHYADFLKSALKKLEINNPILAGHSFGGSVIIKYSANGGKAKKIILIASSGIRQKTIRIYFYIFLAKLGRLFFSLPGLNPIKNKAKKKFHKVIDAEDFSRLTDGPLKETFKNIIGENLKEDLKKIKTDACLIWGKKDITTPLNEGIIMKKLIKGSKIFVIEGAGHYVFLDKEEEFNKIFLNAIR